MFPFLRLISVFRVALKYRVDRLLLPKLRRPSFWLCSFIPGLPQHSPEKSIALCLIELGPLFVKFGQVISTRRDLLSKNLATELAQLQDNVPAFCSKTASSLIEQSLGPLSEHFSHFNPTPLASASIAQVHSATRHDGREVVIKVLRPGVVAAVEKDLALLRLLARIVHTLHPLASQLQAPNLVDEYSQSVYRELDLLKEASNTSHMKHLSRNDTRLYIPNIHWDLCTSKVMVSERIYGVGIANIHALRKKRTSLTRLAENGVAIFFNQLLEYNFFHADMHPGNVFIDCKNPKHPRYIAVDFGIVGQLPKHDQLAIAHNLTAFLNRDYDTMVTLHIASGWVPSDICKSDMSASLRAIGESIHSRPLKEISFALLFSRLLMVAKQYRMIVQPQLALLQKTLFNIEALGRELDPELNIWQSAHPILNAWMQKQRTHTAFEKLTAALDYTHAQSTTPSSLAPTVQAHTVSKSAVFFILLFVFSLGALSLKLFQLSQTL